MTRILCAAAVVCALALSSSGALARDGVGRGCLTWDTRSILERAEAHFGVTFKLVSTCRPGAIIAGTHHPSQHRYGRAVDLLVPRGVSKSEVVRWLYRNAKGVTMTYRNMPHVHFDTGPFHKLAIGGPRRARHHRMAATR